MTSKKSKLSAEDKALFASWVKDVRPMQTHQDKISPARTAPHKIRRNFTDDFDPADTRQWADPQFEEQMLASHEYSSHLSSGIQKQVYKKLKQGKIPREAHLDLHGYTVNQARSRIDGFLSYCQANGIRCICIVHGKGTHNEHGQAVLKSMVHHWLKQTQEVLALCSALPADGGTGALYVLLKKLR